MLYIISMRRTQIYLTEEEWKTLNRASRERHATMASLIREAIDRTYGRTSKAQFIQALHDAAGLWSDRTDLPSTAEYVRNIRDHDRL